MGGFLPPSFAAQTSGPSGLVGFTLVQILVSFAGGVFTVASDDARITSAMFARTSTGNWVMTLPVAIVPTAIVAGWSNVLQDSSFNKNFGSDVHLVPAGGGILDIFVLEFAAGAFSFTDNLQLKLLVLYH